eukprot:scpid74339/ scgid35657/ 
MASALPSNNNYIGAVQEYCQQHGLELAKYVDRGFCGPEFNKQFTCRVSLPNTDSSFTFDGYGSKKKVAKAAAAERLYDKLQRSPPIGRRSICPVPARSLVRETPTVDGISVSLASQLRTSDPVAEDEGDANPVTYSAMLEPYGDRVNVLRLHEILRDTSQGHHVTPLSAVLSATGAPHTLQAFAESVDVSCQFHKVHETVKDDAPLFLTILFVSARTGMERVVTHGCGCTYAESCLQALLATLHQMDVLKVHQKWWRSNGRGAG